MSNDSTIKSTIGCITAILLFTLLTFSCKNKNVEQIKAFSHPPGSPEVVADNLDLLYSDSTVIRFRLKSPKLLVFQDEEEPYKEFPNGFEIQQYNRNKVITSSIKASYGKYYEKKNLWEAKQNVVAVTEKGDSLKTELLYWDEKKNTIHTDQFVKIIQKEQIITGIGFESDLQMKKWKIIQPKGTVVIEVDE
ncbi:MAG TPA: LPS export ABC transporter periplasmic protein LptC [Prolixibacteraceae bacterium]|nr:LPS export ABC transporter periplasmic protein LptC [Prolixibacteraceae bacterium]